MENEFERKQKLFDEEKEQLQKELDTVKKQLHSSMPLEAKDFQLEVR